MGAFWKGLQVLNSITAIQLEGQYYDDKGRGVGLEVQKKNKYLVFCVHV